MEAPSFGFVGFHSGLRLLTGGLNCFLLARFSVKALYVCPKLRFLQSQADQVFLVSQIEASSNLACLLLEIPDI